MPSPAADRTVDGTVDGPVGGAAAAIELKGVSHSYRGRLALGPIDLTIEAGEFVTVVGPSGCGKSTLLRAIAGFTAPTAGGITASGVPVDGPDPSRGFVFQQSRLFPWLTVAANVGFGLRHRPKAERVARVDELLALTGLADAARLRPYELSGGMRQRAAIARALAPGPRVLLMDEPFAALDAFTRERMQDEVRDLWRRTGTTVVFITHSVDEAVYLGTRILALSGSPGRVVLDERSELPVLDHPRTDPRFGVSRERLAEVVRSAAEGAGDLVGDPGRGRTLAAEA
ncbi:ABC transporter ATP-binding protein [Microtetraspora sp. AC03309]|uniref:ABC transporter ATP-binding protein n=1 Tax=Microtetraspora sp. AC03309 TaxID=2779376 RepID=UPI001E5DFC15|nr:ABC transporter ATP-binding protein [Microtetraspora sp. AC03309]MCC5578240.1 ABC transporter ATP-binding protein [Microtetraspora sp. AC03309]